MEKPSPIDVMEIIKNITTDMAYLERNVVKRYESLISAIRTHVSQGIDMTTELSEAENSLDLMKRKLLLPKEAEKIMNEIYLKCLTILKK